MLGNGVLAPLDHAGRAERLRAAMASTGHEALFVTSLTNIRWLTGFTGSNGWVVITPHDVVLVTDGRYTEQAVDQTTAAGVEVVVATGHTRRAMVAHVESAVTDRHIGRLAFESAHISHADHAMFSSSVAAEWTPTSGLIEGLRRTKDRGEIDRMAKAAAIADEALAIAVTHLRAEPTEAEFRDALEWEMRRLGADGPSFDTIIAAGANAALPHHHPDSTRIVEGMTVVIDFGALYDGYHSDMTRTFTIGDPTPMQAEVYEVVLAAQQAGMAAVGPGARGRALDDICRESISKAGWGDWFNHGTGHGVGLLIHESPWLTQSFDDTLQELDVVTVEPGVYRKDFGGVRIEDMVVVTTDGCQSLTKTSKDSPCLPSPPTT
jgi:Xaa-Pro aminopeptidase